MISNVSNFFNSIYSNNTNKQSDAVSGATRKGHAHHVKESSIDSLTSTSSSSVNNVDAVTSATKNSGGDHYFEARA